MDEYADYPVAILEDRYGGVYSKGAWLAIANADKPHIGDKPCVGDLIGSRMEFCLNEGPNGSDPQASDFWDTPPSWIVVGKTPDDALAALKKRGL